jgi:hypothetical protein
MIAELPFELLGDVVEGRAHIGGFGVRSEGPPGDEDGGLDQLQAVGRTGVMLGDELDLEPHQSWLESFQPSQLVFRLRPDLIRHGEAPTREGQLQRRSPLAMDLMALLLGRVCSRPADLVFSPTLACGDVRRRPEAIPPTTDSHPLPYGAGLTSKPLHARRPMVVLRGSFRPRLASTTGVVPRATTDPDGSTLSSIGTPIGASRTARWWRAIRERPARGHQMDRLGPSVRERRRARGGGRVGGQHVVHQQDRSRRRAASERGEGAGHRREPLLPGTAGLRPRGAPASDVGPGREVELARERAGEDLRLIEPALVPPPR